ncbi:uncharacterized protein LOC130649464 isoform X2 [Hydractinia symbiolongicarpus]|uniref:uncharacterized protein LOC130649464 isoform X2 n=1 Tax=Hydractinia symbiolongicarpus TaxID=13093 RepID=UPI00255005BE|nr:uncharacterized protein LOC130649464 isoform X2 [Hydractinia symbiolongicarpus]
MACAQSIKDLIEILKSNNEEEDNPVMFTCQYALMKGFQLQMTPQLQEDIAEWRTTAKEVEKRIQQRKKRKMEILREQMQAVEKRLEHKNKSSLQTTDENHNLYDNNSNSKSTCSQQEFKESIEDDYLGMSIPLSLDSINFKELTTRRRDIENQSPPMIDFTETKQNNEFDLNRYEQTKCQSKEILNVDTQESLSDVGDDLAVHEESTEEVIPEVLEQMKTLHILQEQQKELDDWYHDMQKQLELEKVRLAEKYDQLKLHNIKKQQHVIDSSQEFLRTASLHMSPNVLLQQSLVDQSQSSTPQKFQKVLECSQENLIELNENDFTKSHDGSIISSQSWTPPVQQNTEHQNFFNKPKVKRILPSPPPVTVEPLLLQNTDLVETTPPVITNTYVPLKEPISLIPDLCNFNHSESITGKTMPPLQDQLDTPPVGYNTPSIATPVTAANDVFDSNKSDSATVAQLVHKDTMSELKLRRKSRPIKFFTTPVSENGRSPIKLSDHSHELLMQSREKDASGTIAATSTSTPQEVGKQLVHEFSPVFAQGFQHTLHYEDEIIGQHGKAGYDAHEFDKNPLAKDLNEGLKSKLEAVAEGCLVRMLMKTNKVQEIIKTIKDTQAFLNDIEKEKSIKKNISSADRQLRMRLQEELLNKRNKFHDVFFDTSATDQMKLIMLSRLRREERKTQLSNFQNKEVKTTKEPVHKKLSTASQRSMKRRQDHVNENRPKTAPEKIQSVKKTTEKEQRPLRPIQSHSSPVLSERSRPKSTGGSALQNRYPKKQINKKLNMNSVTNAPTHRVMAAKLASRYSSVL